MDRFDAVLREFRQNAGVSQHKLALQAGVNPAYVNRMERPNGQVPRRDVLNALITTMGLDESQAERLLVAAGYCPESVARLGTWDETLGLVAHVLADDALSDDERDEFRQVIRAVASRWMPVA